MEDYTISFQNLETWNQIIISLYNQNLAVHTRVSNFFRDIASFIYFDRASVMIFYKNEQGEYQKKTSFTINWNQALLQKYDSYFCKIDDTLPPLDRPEPTIIKSSSFFNSSLRSQTEYWNGYMVPNNADYEIMANLQLDYANKYRACLSFTRGKEAGDFSDFHMRILRFFQPHISHLIRGYIEQITTNTELPDAHDYNCIGYCTLNDSCQITKKNSSFDAINKKLDNHLLAKIVSLCIDFDQQADALETIHQEYKIEDEPLFLELTRTPANLGGSKMQYSCLVYDLSRFFHITLKQTREKYQLSDREYHILDSMLHGRKQEEIAEELYLSIPTIKKYVASLYNKLGITNQKQIYTKLNLL